MMHQRAFLFAIVVLSVLGTVLSCTNYLITKGASKEGASMISYAADSHTLYGFLTHYPAADHPAGSWREIYDWDSGKYMGKIPEANHTYNVIGNMNEFQVTIGETTYGGLPSLCKQDGAIMDYGSLIWVTLQRARTAREAIATMGQLVADYGYASEGESFSIGDPDEVWIMEMIGKGQGEKGAVWVARRVPDGYVCSHANQARIQKFPLNDKDNCIYADDVVSFAKKKGLYPESSPDDQFSFSDVYDPVTFEGARFCEVRVWSFFRKVTTGMDQYLEYAKGMDLTNRMPLWVKPTKLISLNDTMHYMRDHLEDTWFDFRYDVGAEAYNMPYRWRPLTWTVDNKEYLHERSVGTQQTGWSFVAQMRSSMPDVVGGLLWFGVDDTASTVYVPMYACMTRVPYAWAEGNGDMMTFTMDAAFWVFNMVANYAYQRYEMIHPDVMDAIVDAETYLFKLSAEADAAALDIYQKSPELAVDYLTEFSVETGNAVVDQWKTFFGTLFTKYMDGNVKFKDPKSKIPIVDWPGYPDAWYKRIVEETGDHYRDYQATSVPLGERKLRLVM
eukprot:TRINITY_DN1039_c0_g1_i2.p1 TRINITY_DN1039_c0_g1~~TRINITY_DN1039_c0_g1_i2.p1  ORF type:complete len:559 (-),score=96.91 TRINITY_DN1039_c0_g1_i2:2006-3682(-)